MLAVVFTVSTGMGFVEHSCQMKGEKAISFSKTKSCCDSKKACHKATPEEQTNIKKSPCCQDKTVYVHIDFANYAQKINKFVNNTLATLVHNLVTVVKSFLHKEETACHYTNTSPPQTGRDTLTKKCTLQI